jgi:THO complex subunit 2
LAKDLLERILSGNPETVLSHPFKPFLRNLVCAFLDARITASEEEVVAIIEHSIAVGGAETKAGNGDVDQTTILSSSTQGPEIVAEAVGDVLWLVGMEIDYKLKAEEKAKSPQWKQLCKVVNLLAFERPGKPLCCQKIRFVLKTALKEDLLEGAKLINSFALFRKKLVKANTRMYYLQQKYNLLKEESEGYGKMITLLSQGLDHDSASVKTCGANLQVLIGQFDLDPNRVLDLVLESFEVCPDMMEGYLQLIRLFKASAVPQVLGFKFQYYSRPTVAEVAPASLFRLAAILVVAGQVEIQELLPHLSPSDTVAVEQYKKVHEKNAAEAKKIGTTFLGGVDKEQEAKDKVQDATDAANQLKAERQNQIVGLLVALLDLRAWVPASQLLEHFKALDIDVTVHTSVRSSLCRLIAWQIAPVLHCTRKMTTFKNNAELLAHVDAERKAAGSGGKDRDTEERLASVLKAKFPAKIPDAVSFLDELPDAIAPTMAAVGPHIRTDIKLYGRIVRLVCEYCKSLSKQQKAAMSGSPKDSALMTILGGSLVPGFSLLGSPGNTYLVYLIWGVMEDLSFDCRFWIYSQWKVSLEKNTALMVPEAHAKEAVKKLMRRVSTENTKGTGRGLAKIAHSNPMAVFEVILSQIENYDNMIVVVLDCFKFLTPLAFDVLAFQLVAYLCRSKDRLKEDGTNVSKWLQSLSIFTGLLFKKYPTTELQGLLQYIISKLKLGHSLDLNILAEILGQMGGCQDFKDIPPDQLEGMAGGENLRAETALVKVSPTGIYF